MTGDEGRDTEVVALGHKLQEHGELTTNFQLDNSWADGYSDLDALAFLRDVVAESAESAARLLSEIDVISDRLTRRP